MYYKRISGNDNDNKEVNEIITNPDDNNLIGVLKLGSNNSIVLALKELAIDTISDSYKRFSKKDQLKANIIYRFQHIDEFLLNSTMIHSINTNGIKNNSITQRDIELSLEMLGPNKYTAKGKTTHT